jgi:hypothetical protein
MRLQVYELSLVQLEEKISREAVTIPAHLLVQPPSANSVKLRQRRVQNDPVVPNQVNYRSLERVEVLRLTCGPVHEQRMAFPDFAGHAFKSAIRGDLQMVTDSARVSL